MGLPIELPPNEVIEALEEKLESSFSHFIISIDGLLDGIFIHRTTGKDIPVTFEAKRVIEDNPITDFKSFMGEMDLDSLSSMREILESVLYDIDMRLAETVTIEYSEEAPKYDDWYCP
tara:strand:- start:218 stop:571 length:354 start_codon:yes stop_codon:yes gene_type:complete